MKAPPPSLGPIREAEERSRAVPVYRALKEWRDGPKQDGTWAELVAASGLFNMDEVISAVQWMRARGVRVVVSIAENPGEHARVALIERLPEAFEPTGV